MREQVLSWRWLAALVVVALGTVAVAVVGLAWFRRGYARRVASFALTPNVELAWGATWLVLLSTLLFVVRHPRTLRFGLVYAAHLLVGIDLLSAIDDSTLAKLHRDVESGS